MVGALDFGASGPGLWPGTLCCVLVKDPLLSHPSPPRFLNESAIY